MTDPQTDRYLHREEEQHAVSDTKRPLGNPTREDGPNRLRRLDVLLLTTMREAITRRDACRSGLRRPSRHDARDPRPVASRESRAVCGGGGDRRRARRTRSPPCLEDTRFLRGGFDVELPRPATILRAMNVLRQYDESEVADAWRRMGRNPAERGLLIEGTCDPWAACWW